MGNNYDKKLYQTLGSYLRKIREDKGYSLEYVAEKIGKTKKTVSRYEFGEHRIDVDIVKSICDVYGINFDDLNKKVEEEIYNASKYQWGSDLENTKYFSDKPELLALYNEIKARDDMYILFDKTKDLEPKDVESVLMFVQTIRKQRGID